MKKKVLVIDDSLLARMAVKKCIPDDRYDIFEANDGASGLNKYKEVRPDITLLDLTMPLMDGFKVLEEIKKINDKAVVIVLTADIQTKTREKVMALGAFTVLKKPPIRNEILEAIDSVERLLGSQK
jgi:two-component system chemotaxis response regulator CheY